jgi:hypothetical protein
MDTRLKNKIMRRVYTAYAMRLAFGTRARYVVLMVLAGLGLARLVSVVDVLRNFSSVSVGQAGDFIIGAFLNTDAATLLVCAVFTYAAVALVRSGKMDIETPRFA